MTADGWRLHLPGVTAPLLVPLSSSHAVCSSARLSFSSVSQVLGRPTVHL